MMPKIVTAPEHISKAARAEALKHGHKLGPLALMPSTALRQTYEAFCSICGDHLLWYPTEPDAFHGGVLKTWCPGHKIFGQ